jgi:GH25 family lysozyme M1 (1,4-beta-N-acetylmuramidase)
MDVKYASHETDAYKMSTTIKGIEVSRWQSPASSVARAVGIDIALILYVYYV